MATITGLHIGAVWTSPHTGAGTYTGLNVGASQDEATGPPPATATPNSLTADDAVLGTPTVTFTPAPPATATPNSLLADDAVLGQPTVTFSAAPPSVATPNSLTADDAILGQPTVTFTPPPSIIASPNSLLADDAELGQPTVTFTPPAVSTPDSLVADDAVLGTPTVTFTAPFSVTPDSLLADDAELGQPTVTFTPFVAPDMRRIGALIVDQTPAPSHLTTGMNSNPPEDVDPQPSANVARAGHWLNDWANRQEFPLDPLVNPPPVWASVPFKAKAGETFDFKIRDITITVQGFPGSYSNDTQLTFASDTDAATVTVTAHNGPNRELDIRHPSQVGNTSFFDSRYMTSAVLAKGNRLLNWNKTNNSPKVTASDRVSYTHFCQSSPAYRANERVSLDFCLECDSDAWLTIPHQADTSYLDAIAQDCQYFLASTNGRKLTLEWSNEVWNSQFTQYAFALSAAQAWGFTGTDKQKVAQAYARYSATMHTFFDGYGFPYDRAVAWQAASGGTDNDLLITEYENTYGSKPQVWSVAPYIHLFIDRDMIRPLQWFYAPQYDGNPSVNATWLTAGENALVEADLLAIWTSNVMLDRIENDPNDGLARSEPWIINQAMRAQANGMEFRTYENGQHLLFNIGNFEGYPTWVAQEYWPTFRSPRWTGIYNRHHQTFVDEGGTDDYFLSLVQIPRDSTHFGHETSIDMQGLASTEELRKAINRLT